MNFKLVKSFLIFCVIFVFALVFLPATVFAEEDVGCSGKITGVTNKAPANPNWNPNAGETSFNAHNGPAAEDNEEISLAILGLADGLAPASRDKAACVEEDTDLDDDFEVKGWAWNTNIGFISLYCNGGDNEGVACGAFDYGVEVDVADSAGFGQRQLLGYGYSDVFGYINFFCEAGVDHEGNACGPFDYGVVRNEITGALSGYAYTSTGVYLNFDGVVMNLPGVEPPSGGDWCDGKPYVCVEVRPAPFRLDIDDVGSLGIADGEGQGAGGPDEAIRLADGEEAYEIHLFLREVDGVTPMNWANYNSLELDYIWEDTVKADQTGSDIEGLYDNTEDTWSDFGKNGAIPFKPVTNFTYTTEAELLNDYNLVAAGHYVLEDEIVSYAPTRNSNISYTTSLPVPTRFLNEIFLSDVGEGDVEPNQLVLKRADVELRDSGGNVVNKPDGGPLTPQYPNGKVHGVSLEYRPVVDLSTLYAGDLQDGIIAYRNIPLNFAVWARRFDSNSSVESNFLNAQIKLKLAYDMTETQNECAVEGKPADDFVFEFIGDEDFEARFGAGNYIFPDGDNSTLTVDADVFMDSEYDTLQGMATLEGEEDQLCSTARSPSIYAIISYQIGGKDIKYYGNKLPRVAGDLISNPVAVIHGNVYAQNSFTPSAEVQRVQESGDVSVNVVLDTVNENMRKYLPDLSGSDPKKYCTVTKFNEGGIDNAGEAGCSNAANFQLFEDIEGEKVFYFKDTDVKLDFAGGDWGEESAVLVVEGGNLFFLDDVYKGDGNNNMLPIVVLRDHGDDFGESGNLYISPDVNNVQSNAVLEGSLFGFDGQFAGDAPDNVDSVSGEPDWIDFSQLVSTLNKQFFWQGSLASLNTIGGADLFDYLIFGTGEVKVEYTLDDQKRAQLFDLNYLRFFRLDVARTTEGLPIDQACEMGLTSEDILDIEGGSPPINPLTGAWCNGIQLNPVTEGGDLVPPDRDDYPELYASGLEGTDDEYEPVVIYFVPPRDTFIFKAPGVVTD